MAGGAGIPQNGENYILGPWLNFDADKESHFGDFANKANALMKDENRKGYEIPDLAHV